MIVKDLGLIDYQTSYQAMCEFTAQRGPDTEDELWLLEHPSVYTQGRNGQEEHILQPTMIPIVKTERGGQVTYHGPGQLIGYTLIDLKAQKIGVREMVTRIETAVITCLAGFGIEGQARKEAPGVYVAGAKIAALGLRVRKGLCYHGLSLNINMDLSPFDVINPCGYPDMTVIDLKSLGHDIEMKHAKEALSFALAAQMQQGN